MRFAGEFVFTECLEGLRDVWSGVVAGPDLCDIAGHVCFDWCEGHAAEKVKECGGRLSGGEEVESRYAFVFGGDGNRGEGALEGVEPGLAGGDGCLRHAGWVEVDESSE